MCEFESYQSLPHCSDRSFKSSLVDENDIGLVSRSVEDADSGFRQRAADLGELYSDLTPEEIARRGLVAVSKDEAAHIANFPEAERTAALIAFRARLPRDRSRHLQAVRAFTMKKCFCGKIGGLMVINNDRVQLGIVCKECAGRFLHNHKRFDNCSCVDD